MDLAIRVCSLGPLHTAPRLERADSKYVTLEGGMRHMYLETIGVNIAGGTADVQRNIIATRGLGLPRGA